MSNPWAKRISKPNAKDPALDYFLTPRESLNILEEIGGERINQILEKTVSLRDLIIALGMKASKDHEASQKDPAIIAFTAILSTDGNRRGHVNNACDAGFSRDDIQERVEFILDKKLIVEDDTKLSDPEIERILSKTKKILTAERNNGYVSEQDIDIVEGALKKHMQALQEQGSETVIRL